MTNEEPEGPNLPPKKTAVSKSAPSILEEVKCVKAIEAKGLIAGLAGVIVVASYLVYYYYFFYNDVKLNELYFISSGVGTAIFTGLLFTFFINTWVKTILLFTSVFYTVLELIYVIAWIIFGQPYAYLKQALIVGLIIGIIYFIYDKFINKPRSCNNGDSVSY